ncbi:MAG: ATP-binding cassette domain-containing protein [Dehalococcoidia bacterium]|nr:ATP-binding cassette domain-containing protein [Dehalococcoidia bacterium]
MAETDAVLEVSNLKKYFPVTKGIILRRTVGQVQAVDDVSFTIRRGETFALAGESGCGKTTTSRVLLLLEEATSGQVLFRGQDILHAKPELVKEYRRSVQAVFQDPYSSLEPRMRVRDIITEPLRATSTLTKDQMRTRVGEVLTQVGLNPDTATRFPHEFSGGQRQRIALARCLASSPDLILLDEPVSGLDVSIRAQILNLLKDLQDQLGVAYLLVAHDLATVRHMCTGIAIMYLGRLVETGSGEAVFGDPIHPYTKALLSAALPSHPRIQRTEIELPGEVPSPLNPPKGCRFHPRCPIAVMPLCGTEVPQLDDFGGGHLAACHLAKKP